MRSTRPLIAAGAAVALALSLPTSASAASDPPTPQQWSDQVAMPYSLTVDGHRVLVADGAMGMIGQLQSDGSIEPIITGAEGTTSVATRGKTMAYTTSLEQGEEAPPLESGLTLQNPRGTTYVDLHAYEYANNPDQGNTYGFIDSCLGDAGMNAGITDAHAYTVVAYGGDWLVADAGANVVWRVTDAGDISVFALFPPVPVEVTEDVLPMFGGDDNGQPVLPDCVVGSTFNAEPVPTGITVGSGGVVYVTTLPGFPGMVTGAGQLWRIDRNGGEPNAIASGLAGPTSVTMAGNGAVYVAQLFGGGVAKVSTSGEQLGFIPLPNALAVSTASNGTLWAATAAATDEQGNPTGPGTIVSVSKGKVKVNGHVLR